MEPETFIDRYRLLIETEFGIKDRDEWDNQTFEKLSSGILEKTGERLSVSTLKRIWGKVSYDHAPAKSTLNILARYAGYENWRSFTVQNATAAEKSSLPIPNQGRYTTWRVAKKWLTFTALIVLLTSAVLLNNRSAQSSIKTSFEARQTSDDLPNSVIFNYSVSGGHADHVMIQQSWDSTRREEVNAEKNKHASIYYYPGYFVAKLIVNGKIEKETPIFIQTKGWKAMIKKKSMPVYLSTAEIRTGRGLGVEAATILKKTGTSVFNDIWTEFANVRSFGDAEGDNFRLETTLANTSTAEESVCRNIKITLLGKEGAIIVPLSVKGCEADLRILTGEQWINGREDDLSALGCSFPEFQQVAVEVSGARFHILINGKLAVDKPVSYKIGQIVGLRYAFEGTGAIRHVALYSGKKAIYREDFN